MRLLLGCIMAAALALLPAAPRANAAGSDDSPAKKATGSSLNSTSEAATNPDAAAEPAKSSLESEIEELRDLLLTQSQQLQAQSDQLKQQQEKMQMLEGQLNKASGAPARLAEAPGPAPSPAPAPSSGVPTASMPTASIAIPSAATPAAAPQGGNAIPESPLQFRLGSAFFTPIGFMDFTGVFRSHNAGGGIGSNFASIPYDFTAPGAINLLNHVNEARLSMQNSRLGLRVDALVKGAHVMGYVETDFLGNNPNNVAISSNSNTLRSRVYWVDVTKDKWEFLGGQTWSLITPGRTGISPLPGNLFYSQDIDVNYQAGLVWGRIPEFRFVFHPSSKAAVAFALDNQEQYWGGSAGGPKPVLPTGPTVVSGVAGLPGSQLNDASATTVVNAPQLAPDVIVKIALDPSAKFHFEIGGVERQFRVAVNSTTSNTSPVVHQRMSGGGGFVNLNFQLLPGFRVLTNNYWSQAGGRYIFGQVPDLILNPDGSLSPIKASSTVSGVEYTRGKMFLYAYYGGIYAYRDVGLVNGAEYGYGVDATAPGSFGTAISQNRTIQEYTVGFNQTFWRDNKYGALNLMGQYSYLTRDPWRVATGPNNAKLNIVFLNLRYTLPGAAPAAAELR